MKKIICIVLAALLLTGCQAVGDPTDPIQTTVAPTQSGDPTETAIPETTVPQTIVPETQAPVAENDEISFTDPGKARIAYEGMRSFARYITTPEELPELPELADFDSAFFETHALVLVVETVNSGSVQLEIDKMIRSGDEATVHLKRTMSGEVGTSDMATWLLWAVVSREYDCSWKLESANALYGVEKF